MRIRVAILAVLALPAGPGGTYAQSEPFRVVNATGVTATGLNAVPSGEGAPWGADLLGGRTMAPGAAFSLRAPEGIGCIFDIRLTLRDGREVERREVDICRQRTIAVTMQDAAILR